MPPSASWQGSASRESRAATLSDLLAHEIEGDVANQGERLLYCDHVEADGEGRFRLACEHDLEGIVAKHKYAPYLPDREPTWFKIRNSGYSQWLGHGELFERERERNADESGWDKCVKACAALAGRT